MDGEERNVDSSPKDAPKVRTTKDPPKDAPNDTSKDNAKDSTAEMSQQLDDRQKKLLSLLYQRKSVISRYQGKARRIMADLTTRREDIHRVMDSANRIFYEVEQIFDELISLITDESLIERHDKWYSDLENDFITFTLNVCEWLNECGVNVKSKASAVLGASNVESSDTRLSADAKSFYPKHDQLISSQSVSSDRTHTPTDASVAVLNVPTSQKDERDVHPIVSIGPSSTSAGTGAAVYSMPTPQSECSALQQAISALHLSNAVVDKFDGDPIKYTGFMAGFKARILTHVNSDSDRLYQLYHLLEGEPKEMVSGALHIDASEGYVHAIRMLEREYGAPHVVCSACVRKFTSLSPVQSNEIHTGSQEID